jgi:hypothetical protein
MSAPRAIRGCLSFWAVAFILIALLILLINVVEAVAHAHGWY